jgi:NAD(P)-dependent dehydrogenase (short-subunit alcohol dehydrogenase family)
MIIITGASKGIGRFLTEEFISLNEDVFGFYNSSLISELLWKEKYVQINVSDYEKISKWVKENAASLKNITLINCAAINYNSFAHKADIHKWTEVINVNIIGTFNVIHALLPLMREQNFGRIINFGSVVADLPSPGISAYATSKSALFGLSKSLAAENAVKGVTVNNINLGYSELGMISQVPEDYLKEILKKIPSGKLCSKEDIFKTVQFIRSNEYLNGANINLNGGLI